MDIRHRTFLSLTPLLIVSIALIVGVPVVNARMSELAGNDVETLSRMVNIQDLEVLTLKQRNNIARMVRGFAIYRADYQTYREEIAPIVKSFGDGSVASQQRVGRYIGAAYAELDAIQEETVAAVLRGDLALATSMFNGPVDQAMHALLGATTAVKQRDRGELSEFEQSAGHLGQRSIVMLGVGVGSAVFLAFVLSWLLMLDVLRPIEVLAGDALRYSSGDTPGELSPVQGIKQLQHLRDSLQSLLDLTLARQERLRRANGDLERQMARERELRRTVEGLNEDLARAKSELERRVEERTEELRRNSARLQIELTERERAEIALREIERRFQAFMDNSPSPAWITDEDDALVYVSRPCLQLFVPGSRGVAGERIAELLPAAWARRYPSAAEQVRATNEVLEERITYARPDGAQSYSLCHMFAIDVGGKRLVGGSAIDITARIVAEEQIKQINEELERRVVERTAELAAAQQQLVETARQAGMAEVATNVLHNVGNVLNGVNVSVALLQRKLGSSKAEGVNRVTALVSEHAHDLRGFLAQPRRTEQLVDYLKALSKAIAEERESVLVNVEELTTGVEHLKALIHAQQRYAGQSSLIERVDLCQLVEDALRMNDLAVSRNTVRVVRDMEEVGLMLLDRHKLLQILMNLLSNAKYAMDEKDGGERELTLRVKKQGEDRVRVCVGDTGIGIAPENLERLFRHGFTTRAHGHGFGLHSCLLAAEEMGGKLTVASEGVGCGTVFTLELPVRRA